MGGATVDELDGQGLIFSDVNPTALTIVDAANASPGDVTVQGPVTLGASTTTTMNYVGASGASDLLNVQNGTLTLNGTLQLNSVDGVKPSPPLFLFSDGGNTPAINGQFTSIKDGVNGTDSWAISAGNPLYWQLSIR